MITLQQLEDAKKRAEAAGNTDAVNELSEKIAQFSAEVDVLPIFSDLRPTPETPAMVEIVNTVGDAIGGIVTPTTVGATIAASNPIYNALTKERGITLPKEEGEKKGKKITGDEARARLSDARSGGQVDFETQRDLNAEKLQQQVDAQTAQLGPQANKLQSSIDAFNSQINQTNALTSKSLSQGDTFGADQNQQKAQQLAAARDVKQAELDAVNKQIADAQGSVANARNAQMSATQAIDIDSQALQAMGITPPDVTKELQSGDIDGARKKMSDVLEKNLQSKTAWMKSAVDYMKKNPGKAIPRALGKIGKATFTGDSIKKGLISGTAGGLLTNVGMGLYDAAFGDYLSDEEIQAERRRFEELGKLAERYRNPSRGENTMYLNPLIPEQKQVIEQLQEAQADPSRAHLLYNANPKQ